MIKNDVWITEQGENLVRPFYSEKVSQSVISYGTSQCGYDLTLSSAGARLFASAFDNKPRDLTPAWTIDPKNFEAYSFVAKLYLKQDSDTGDMYYVLPGQSSMLGSVTEHLNIPADIMGRGHGKSTYLRCNVKVFCEPIEPGWKGHLSILIVNFNRRPVRIYANEGILQVTFEELSAPVKKPYAGEYQDQGEVATFAKIGA